DAFQAGLSWQIVLRKREGFRKAFANFDAETIATYDDDKIAQLLTDATIIRNRAKVKACVSNARAFLSVQKEFGSFDKYIWQFTDHKTIVNHWNSVSEVPPRSPESDAMSLDLQKRGFKFVGSTICYAFMQAAGMINDHMVNCFRYKELVANN
ncbi:MAG TPA: DNA-3-methyladenine glycosylase I, partial [Bacteroidales bacterium]|nr:DNA-3-methyladenine glycosylase I [Bacteroidales bacterium]